MALTKEQTEYVHQALKETWNRVGHDVMQAAAEFDQHSMPRDHVVEVTLDNLDAYYVPLAKDEMVEALRVFAKLPYVEKIGIARGAFPFERYC